MCAASVRAADDTASRLFKEGEKAERAGDVLHAYILYSRASALEPTNPTYALRKNALHAIAALSTHGQIGPDPADKQKPTTPSLDELSATDLRDERQPIPPPELSGLPGKKSFNLTGDARDIFPKVAEAYGLTVVFDPDYQPPPPFRFQMDDVDYQDALRGLEAVSNSFLRPVGERLAIVARDTAQNRTALEPTEFAAIPIPERISVKDAQEAVTAVQQALEIRHITVDPGHRLVVMRDQVPKVEAARRIFTMLSRLRTQIEVEVQFLSVDKTLALNYGVNLQNQFSLVNFGKFMNNTPFLSGAFSTFLRFGGGSTLFGIGITEASAFATVARASTTNLLDAQMVTLDGQEATLHVGQRYPIITNGYYGNATGTGQVYSPPPTVNFEDLGLVLKVTPSVHEDNEVTLDVDSEFKLLASNSAIAGIPIVSNRSFTGKVRLKEGEWAVLAGLVQFTDTDTRTGFPGLSKIPVLGRIFGQNSTEHDSSEVLLVLKPHLVTLPPWEIPTPAIWLGTETHPLTQFSSAEHPPF